MSEMPKAGRYQESLRVLLKTVVWLPWDFGGVGVGGENGRHFGARLEKCN